MRIGINGFGRIGRLVLRAGFENPELEFVAINDPGAPIETMALLMEFDSVHGRFAHAATGEGSTLKVGDKSLEFRAEREPEKVDWGKLGVDIVLECSGYFAKTDAAKRHIAGGAKKVVVSAPVKDGAPNIVVGVNDQAVDLAAEPVVSAASCTTNCLTPIVRVLHDSLGIEQGLVTTIHAPTNGQTVVDAPTKDPRRSRAAFLNMIPTSTGSAAAVTKVIPELAGKLDAVAVRVPALNASLTDCVFSVGKDTTVEEVNDLLTKASESGPLAGILGVESRPLVSADFTDDPRSSIVDLPMTRVTDKRLVKVMSWYDNEWGYANRLADLAALVSRANR